MAITPLNSFLDVQNFINGILAQNHNTGMPAGSPHKAFWSTMNYDEFVHGNLPNTTDDNGNPIPILMVGNSAASNIILALSGTGPLFGPDDVGIMPPNPGIAFTADQVKSIANWIDAKCPNPPQVEPLVKKRH
jgi:hypothetical protein